MLKEGTSKRRHLSRVLEDKEPAMQRAREKGIARVKVRRNGHGLLRKWGWTVMGRDADCVGPLGHTRTPDFIRKAIGHCWRFKAGRM